MLGTEPDTGSGVFYRNSAVHFTDITDGTSNTLAIGERGAFFAQGPWAGVMTGGTIHTTPGAPVYSSIVDLAPGMVLARVGPHTLNSPNSEPYDFFSTHGQVVPFLFSEGSVHAAEHQHGSHRPARSGHHRRRGGDRWQRFLAAT